MRARPSAFDSGSLSESFPTDPTGWVTQLTFLSSSCFGHSPSVREKFSHNPSTNPSFVSGVAFFLSFSRRIFPPLLLLQFSMNGYRSCWLFPRFVMLFPLKRGERTDSLEKLKGFCFSFPFWRFSLDVLTVEEKHFSLRSWALSPDFLWKGGEGFPVSRIECRGQSWMGKGKSYKLLFLTFGGDGLAHGRVEL